METIKIHVQDIKSLYDAANSYDRISGLIHRLWEMDKDYITTLNDIQTGLRAEREKDEDPASVLEELRNTYAPTPSEIIQRGWWIGQISEILQEVEAFLCVTQAEERVREYRKKSAAPQPAPVPSTSEVVAAQPDTVCVNSEALDNIQQLTAMVKDLHAEQVHTEKMLARCRDLMMARGISEDEINQQSE